jgi:hypothetical protein
MIESIIDMKPTCFSSCSTTTSGERASGATPGIVRASDSGIVPGGSSRSGCSFSQPRLITMTSPPKLGLRVMLRSVRIGTIASGASMATPQP